MHRRMILKLLAGGVLLAHTPALFARSLTDASKPGVSKRVIWIVQRGAVDGLHTVIPTFEPSLATLRPDLYKAVIPGLALNAQFSLHPSLQSMHALYRNKELLPIIATGTGYKGRSHFSGQDFLESGRQQVDLQSGWIGRAMDVLQSEGVALSKMSPLGFRPSLLGQNYFPSALNDASDGLFEELSMLYQYDENLHNALESGLKVNESVTMGKRQSPRSTFAKLCQACTDMLNENTKVQFAMLEMGGWDTHKSQISRLNREFKQLDDGLITLKQGLGKAWQDTLVIITSEFGRTVRQNGTAGTDHGTGGTMFLAGGAINGGQVLGNWPGIAPHELLDNRDLMPTSNTFSWMTTAITQHLELAKTQRQAIFPDHPLYKNLLLRK